MISLKLKAIRFNLPNRHATTSFNFDRSSLEFFSKRWLSATLHTTEEMMTERTLTEKSLIRIELYERQIDNELGAVKRHTPLTGGDEIPKIRPPFRSSPRITYCLRMKKNRDQATRKVPRVQIDSNPTGHSPDLISNCQFTRTKKYL